MKSNMASELAGHLDDMICAQGAAEALATGGVGDEGATHVRVNMEDLRVRDYAVEEKKQNRLWLAVSAELAALGTMLEVIFPPLI
jgi:hypothetical protein